jgi:hypothetical protein
MVFFVPDNLRNTSHPTTSCSNAKLDKKSILNLTKNICIKFEILQVTLGTPLFLHATYVRFKIRQLINYDFGMT